MIRNSNFAKLFSKIYIICVIFILTIDFTVATVYYPKSPDSVISEGIWEQEVETLKPETQLSQGASRLDVSGVLTNLGTRQGASMFAMITFPLLFPIIILVGLGMLMMSFFGTNGLAAVGRRSDNIGNSLGGGNSFPGFDYVPPGYKLDGDGFHSLSLTNRQGFAFDEVETDTCMERFACELLLRGGPKVIGKKSTFVFTMTALVHPIYYAKNAVMASGNSCFENPFCCPQTPEGAWPETHHIIEFIPREEIQKSLEMFFLSVQLGEMDSLGGKCYTMKES